MAYLLRFVYRHYAQGDTGYAVSNLIALLCAVIFMGGQLPFGMLVNLIYPFVGYFGALFIVVVIVQMIRWRIDRARGITR